MKDWVPHNSIFREKKKIEKILNYFVQRIVFHFSRDNLYIIASADLFFFLSFHALKISLIRKIITFSGLTPVFNFEIPRLFQMSGNNGSVSLNYEGLRKC